MTFMALVGVGVGAGVGCDVSKNGGSPSVQTGDPVVVDYPVAYILRPLPKDENDRPVPFNVLDPKAFHRGAQLLIKDRASASAPEKLLTGGLFRSNLAGVPALYDVKDLSVSPDGYKLLFALRAPEIEGVPDNEQPTWNIWEYDSLATPDSAKLRRVIASDLQAERGDDVAPRYLPNGKIVFSSNRQARTRAILTDELKPQYSGLDDKRTNHAFVLHVMDDDGENIEQITYNVSNDLWPTVLENGNLLFLRRDGINDHEQLSLYTSKTDGSDLQPYYGYFNQMTGTQSTEATYVRPLPLPDGRILSLLQPSSTVRYGGDMIAIDGEKFFNAPPAAADGTAGSNGAQVSLSPGSVDTTGRTAAIGGLYSSVYPLYDGTDRLLVSWSPCRLVNRTTSQIRPCAGDFNKEGLEPADPLYGLWIYNTKDSTHLPIQVPQEGFMLTEAVVMAPNIKATPWQPDGLDPKLVEENVGLVHIRSVYDVDGVDLTPQGISAVADPAQTLPVNRPVRFLRIVKNVPIPDDDVLDFDDSIFGPSQGGQGMRDIVGYVPVEPDGSALFKVPADIPVMFDLLDADGKRVTTRHENWLHLRAGEQRECTGCHATASTAPHGRRDLEKASVNLGAIGGVAFANSRLLDKFGTPQPLPMSGESMAQYYARVNGPRTPSVDIIFADEWTNPASAAPGPAISLRYVDIGTRANANPSDSKCAPLTNTPMTWAPPTQCVDAGSWTSICRTTINYLDSIAPLWQADRRSCDDAGAVTTDNTCTSCHTRVLGGVIQVPAGQLELTSEISEDQNEYITSYAELMFDDNAQEVVEMSLTDKKVPDFELDANGDRKLDENGQPIPIMVPVPVTAIMSTEGARSSNGFFRLFTAGGTHVGRLSPAELKLIAEWLDIGGQYYNNPFVAPAN